MFIQCVEMRSENSDDLHEYEMKMKFVFFSLESPSSCECFNAHSALTLDRCTRGRMRCVENRVEEKKNTPVNFFFSVEMLEKIPQAKSEKYSPVFLHLSVESELSSAREIEICRVFG